MVSVEENVILAPFTTLGVGGPARFFVRVFSTDDIRRVFSFAKEKKLPLIPIGEGSNIFVSDKGVNAVVVKNEITGMEWKDIEENLVEVKVSAGENWDNFVEESVKRGLYGAENLSGIPGTVGAAPVQNIGAYGVELSDIIFSLEVYDANEEKFFVFKKEDCNFGYRESFFKKSSGRFLITTVTMHLSKDSKLICYYKDLSELVSKSKTELTSFDVRKMILDIRSKKFPDKNLLGSAGSFFKNPVISNFDFEKLKAKYPEIPSYFVDNNHVKIPLAWILDKVLKLRGVRCGAVGLFKSQPLVLVTYDNATSDNVVAFTEEIKMKVKNETGIDIECEVNFL